MLTEAVLTQYTAKIQQMIEIEMAQNKHTKAKKARIIH